MRTVLASVALFCIASGAHPRAARAEPVEARAEAPASSDANALAVESAWRLYAGLGDEHAGSTSSERVGLARQATFGILVERSLDEAYPWLSLIAGLSTRRGDEMGGLSARLTEGQLGIAATAPELRAIRFARGYARMSALIGRADLDLSAVSELSGHALVPGLEGALGMRFGRSPGKSSAGVRWFGFAEGGYALRRSVTISLRSNAGGDDETPLGGPATPLGTLALSAWAWRLGVGVEL